MNNSFFDNTILFESLKNDSYDIFVQKLFNYSSLINISNEKNESLLHFTSFLGMIDKYYALINVGSEPNITLEGNNLLHYASFSGKDNFLVVELVKSGISPIAINNNKQTSLHLCENDKIAHYLNLWCIRNKIDVTKLLDIDNNNVAHGCKMAGNHSAAQYWVNNYPVLGEQKNDYNKKWLEVKKKFYQFC